MYYTKHSRKLDTDITFFVTDQGGYLFVEIGNERRQQACNSGDTRGECIYISFEHTENDQETFKIVCDRWYRSFIKNQ